MVVLETWQWITFMSLSAVLGAAAPVGLLVWRIELDERNDRKERSKRLELEPMFCGDCGQAYKIITTTVGFDRYTGHPETKKTRRCPAARTNTLGMDCGSPMPAAKAPGNPNITFGGGGVVPQQLANQMSTFWGTGNDYKVLFGHHLKDMPGHNHEDAETNMLCPMCIDGLALSGILSTDAAEMLKANLP